MQFNSIVAVGDIHGVFREGSRIYNLADLVEPGSLVIQVGDFGLGFFLRKHEDENLRYLDDHYGEHGAKLWAIRGNHDDPAAFRKGEPRHEELASGLKNVKFLPDYTRADINGTEFLFVGGAVSVDRINRIVNQSYWKDEIFKYLPEELEGADPRILITHSCPDFLDPTEKNNMLLDHYAGKDPFLLRDLAEERAAHTLLLNSLKKVKKHYYGHFHKSQVQVVNGVMHRCMHIGEAAEIYV